jgi:hypothetical protein
MFASGLDVGSRSANEFEHLSASQGNGQYLNFDLNIAI